MALENGDVDHATLQSVPSRGVLESAEFFFSTFARWPLVFFFLLLRRIVLSFPPASRALALPLFVSPTRTKQQARLDRRVDIVCASPSSRHLLSGSALSAAPSPLPTTTTTTTSCRQRARFLRRCRYGRASASAFFQRASRCAFEVRFSTRRVEALSHAGERKKEATGECVARGVNCEKRKRERKV